MNLNLKDLTKEESKLLYYLLEYSLCISRGEHLGSISSSHWEMLIYNTQDKVDPITFYTKVYHPIKELADNARTSNTTVG